MCLRYHTHAIPVHQVIPRIVLKRFIKWSSAHDSLHLRVLRQHDELVRPLHTHTHLLALSRFIHILELLQHPVQVRDYLRSGLEATIPLVSAEHVLLEMCPDLGGVP